MLVTALSTAVAVNPELGENASRDASTVSATVAGVINELADAGLVITGADIAATHPLARLVSRASVVYEFYRDDSYTPVQLVEFSGLAEQAPTVFQLGNGPIRNIDGENLQAPGKAIKCPVAQDAVARRQSSTSELEGKGLAVDREVPPVLGAGEARLRGEAEIHAMMRSEALVGHVAGLVLAGEAPETDDLVSLNRTLMTARERDFLSEVGAMLAPGETFRITESLRDEARVHLTSIATAEALAWVIGRISVPPERIYAPLLDPEALKIGPLVPGDGQVKTVVDCLAALDVAHLIHHSAPQWCDREALRLARGWNRALGWALWPRAAWGQSERVI